MKKADILRLRFFKIIIFIIGLSAFTGLRLISTDGKAPNRDYPASEVGKIISPQMGTRHQNQPVFFNGYAILAGNAEHEVFEL